MKVRTAKITIEGTTNASFSKFITNALAREIDKCEDPHGPPPKLYLQRMHLSPQGQVLLNGVAMQKGLAAAAKHLGLSIPGKGKQKYAGFFERAVIVPSPWVTNKTQDDVKVELLLLDGQPGKGPGGGGTRVPKWMPYIEAGWKATGELVLLDECITPSVLEQHIEANGLFNGIGRWRPGCAGQYGRFKLVSCKVD